MKILTCIAVPLLFVLLNTYAQKGNTIEQEDFDKLKTTITYVVLDDHDSRYNTLIREGLERYWKITKVEYITTEQFNKMKHDLGKSFLLKVNRTIDGSYNATFLSLILGYNKNKVGSVLGGGSSDDLKYAIFLSAVVMDSEDVEKNSINKISLYIRAMQIYLDEKCKKRKPELSNNQVIQKSTLYMEEDQLNKKIAGIAEIKKLYPYNVSLVTREEISKRVAAEEENSTMLDIVKSEGINKSYFYKSIFSLKDGRLLYYTAFPSLYEKNDGFLKSDFKAIGK